MKMPEQTDFMQPCAVIGANGYLGSHLAHSLEQYGCKVYRFDMQSVSLYPAKHYEKLDVREKKAFEKIPGETGTLFFFAGLTGTHAGFGDYEAYLNANELGLLHLLDHLKDWPTPPRVVFPSSRLVYRGSQEPLKEDDPLEARTVYAANKIAAEFQLQAWSARWNIPYTICRICVPYGTFSETGYSFGTIGFFLKMAQEQGKITLYGDGQARRTFTHIKDLCNQVIAIALESAWENGIFNIAGETWSLKEAAHLIAEVHNAVVEHTEWPEPDLKVESGDTVFDDTKIRFLLNHPVRHSFAAWVRMIGRGTKEQED
jgi:UDP-glucose 4-epimerase